jgi:hypothetical protein
MSTAKIIEITSTSPNSFEEAIKDGLERAGKSIEHIEGAWIKEQKVEIEDNKIKAYRVDMKVTFLLE